MVYLSYILYTDFGAKWTITKSHDKRTCMQELKFIFTVLSEAEIKCPLFVLHRVRIIEVLLKKILHNIFCRDIGNCPHKKAVRIRELPVNICSTVSHDPFS